MARARLDTITRPLEHARADRRCAAALIGAAALVVVAAVTFSPARLRVAHGHLTIVHEHPVAYLWIPAIVDAAIYVLGALQLRRVNRSHIGAAAFLVGFGAPMALGTVQSVDYLLHDPSLLSSLRTWTWLVADVLVSASVLHLVRVVGAAPRERPRVSRATRVIVGIAVFVGAFLTWGAVVVRDPLMPWLTLVGVLLIASLPAFAMRRPTAAPRLVAGLLVAFVTALLTRALFSLNFIGLTFVRDRGVVWLEVVPFVLGVGSLALLARSARTAARHPSATTAAT